MSFSFISHITDYLARPKLGDQLPPTQWPSEASALIKNSYGEDTIIGKCQRAAFFRLLIDNYTFLNEPGAFSTLIELIQEVGLPTDPYVLWIWKAGDLYEDYCRLLAKESGIYISEQNRIYIPEYNLSGKVDLIIINPDTGKLHIVEVKSVYGYNANNVLGTPAQRSRGLLGTPRESNLMQIGLYQWWYANARDNFDNGILTYGARDTGRYGEYAITVEEINDMNHIFYQGIAPNVTKKVDSGIAIENILENFKYVKGCINSGIVPPRSFELKYDEATLQKMFDREELTKAEIEQFSKREQQMKEGKKRIVKQVERGAWQCKLCQWIKVCYDSEGKPTEL